MRMHLWGAALFATVVAAPAFGQTGPGGTGTTGGTATTTTARDARHDDGFDWGWIGLLGLYLAQRDRLPPDGSNGVRLAREPHRNS